MPTFSYETVVWLSQATSLTLFMALFLIVIGYVFFVASRDRLEDAQRKALDLGQAPDRNNLGGRA